VAQPTDRQLKAMKSVAGIEQGQTHSFINPDAAEECEKLGWLEHQHGTVYTLSENGRSVLQKSE